MADIRAMILAPENHEFYRGHGVYCFFGDTTLVTHFERDGLINSNQTEIDNAISASNFLYELTQLETDQFLISIPVGSSGYCAASDPRLPTPAEFGIGPIWIDRQEYWSDAVTYTKSRTGYKDLMPTGEFSPGGVSDPTLKTLVGNILLPAFTGSGGNNQATFRFHFNHDLVPGSDFYFHVHWANKEASPTGNVKWKVTWYYARGYELGQFDNELITEFNGDVNSTPLTHQISESEAVTPLILGEDVQIDGVIVACLERDTTDTNADDAFLIELDIHYESDMHVTIDKNESGDGFIKV